MKAVDKRKKFDQMLCSYQVTKDQRVFIYWHEKLVKTLKEHQANRFIEMIDNSESQEAQLIMARATENFKRGNERIKSELQR